MTCKPAPKTYNPDKDFLAVDGLVTHFKNKKYALKVASACGDEFVCQKCGWECHGMFDRDSLGRHEDRCGKWDHD